jgi:hypothetical protein
MTFFIVGRHAFNSVSSFGVYPPSQGMKKLDLVTCYSSRDVDVPRFLFLGSSNCVLHLCRLSLFLLMCLTCHPVATDRWAQFIKMFYGEHLLTVYHRLMNCCNDSESKVQRLILVAVRSSFFAYSAFVYGRNNCANISMAARSLSS